MLVTPSRISRTFRDFELHSAIPLPANFQISRNHVTKRPGTGGAFLKREVRSVYSNVVEYNAVVCRRKKN